MREFYLENQMNDFLSKPMEMDSLNGVLLRWLPREKIVADAEDGAEAGGLIQIE
jgi:hypothetical protein